jgi:DNA-binding transcriptional MocR family regulator
MAATPDTPLYLQMSQRIAGLIRSGALKRGDRLSSVREAARAHGVSAATVVQAYRTLEDAQLVEARPKSGYFVSRSPNARPPVPGITQPPSASTAVDVMSMAERVLGAAVDPTLVSFGAACPGPDLFPLEKLRRAMARAAQRQRASLGRYPLTPGASVLREAVARRALAMGCELDPQQIVITNGCLESISLCLQAVTRPGDVVALESPTYFGFLQILQTLHLRALEIPTHPRTGMSLPALELALDTQPVKAVLAVPTLSNPLGATMPQADRRRLAALLGARGIPLIEDVIYNELCDRGDGRRAVKSYDRGGHVMVCGSYSKTLAPGIRTGWVEAGRWSTQVRRLKAVLTGGHTEMIEWAMADVLTQPGYEPGLRQLRRTVELRLDEARGLIAESFPAGTRVTDPPGGFILWVELPGEIDATALFHAALAEGICFAPGPMFSATPRYRHCLRLGLGGRWDGVQQQALRRLGALARELQAAGGGLPPALQAA